MLAALSVLVPDTQLPGDRPAANPRATRSVVLARNGVVATSQPLASAAGLRVLQQGGNAIDAAITAAAVLAVVEPTMNGIGGDLFAIVYDAKTKSVRGLNASGRAPAAATPEEFRRRKLDEIPYRGVLSVSVPGVVDGWHELLAKHGTLTLARALEPAIGYARDGFAVSEIIAHQWKAEEKTLAQDPAAAATFLPGGRAPATGDVFRNPKLAATLELIARGGRDAFYRGPIAEAIAADMKTARRACSRPPTSPRIAPTGSTPISTNYRGYDVLELPPNTQGVVALEMLNILEGFDLKSLGHNSAAYLHLLVEAKRIAFADRAAWLGDLRCRAAGWRSRGSSRRSTRPSGGARSIRRARPPSYEPLARRLTRRQSHPNAPQAQGRHDLPDRRRSRRQRRLADSVDLRELRRRHRRRRHRHHAAQSRQPVLAASLGIRTCSRRASGRSTRSCPRW